VLYKALTGHVPFPREEEFAKIAAHLNASRPSATKIQPGLPAEIDLVIARGMAVSPTERYASAGELAAHAGAVMGVPARRSVREPLAISAPATPVGDDAPTRAPAVTSIQPAGPNDG
jgi:hypothetical protein